MRVVTLLPFLALLAGCQLTAPESPEGAPWLLVPDVGQGHGLAVVRGDRAVVVDAGPPDQSALDRALREAGVREIELLVLTHPDLDHVGGLDSLTVPVRRILHGALAASDSARVLGRCRALPDGCLHALAPDSLNVLSGLQLRILGPADPSLHEETNANSLVVEFRQDGRGLFLASGDLDTLGELALLSRLEPVEVVQLGHHGSSSSSHLRWLGALSPRVVVVQAGIGNPYGHPAPPTLARVLAVGARVERPVTDPLRVDF
jgi:competence protein ComEC